MKRREPRPAIGGGDQGMANDAGAFLKRFFSGEKNSLASLFSSRRRADDAEEAPLDLPIPELSPLANSVVSRCCSKIINVPRDKLKQSFESEFPDHKKQRDTYAEGLFEYCCFKALHLASKNSDYLADKEFRRLTFDMMLACEAPGARNESLSMTKEQESASPNHSKDSDIKEEDGASIFYSNSTELAVQVDEKMTVNMKAFVRIAPACPTIADKITVHNLFDALTSSSSGQLHFLIYDKYLKSLYKEIKSAKSIISSSIASALHLTEGEVILDVDGGMPTQPVLQHIGISAWPGRLTLTTKALYFEPLQVGSNDNVARYDLETDLNQVIKRELTGPLGARIFDKAVMYKSSVMAEPIYIEFPEFKGHSRREYWLEIIHEVFLVHNFIRKFDLDDIQRAESLSMVILGIFRYRALKEAFRIFPSHFKTILPFNLAEKLPKGDQILEALYNYLKLLISKSQSQIVDSSTDRKLRIRSLPFSLYTVNSMGFMLLEVKDVVEEKVFLVGARSPLEMAVEESFSHSEGVEAAQATLDQVKFEGLDTNLALMQELLLPTIKLAKWFRVLIKWEDPLKSASFLALNAFIIYRAWVRYVFSFIFLSVAMFMLWHKFHFKRRSLEPLHIRTPPSKNTVEQLLTLQDSISRVETIVQAANVILLKLRALLLAAIPKATENAAFMLIVVAAAVAFLPLKQLMLMMYFDTLTRKMPLRRRSTEKFTRRFQEWWARIPAAPVEMVRTEENKKTK